MTKYRKRPVVIDAIQFTGSNVAVIAEEFGLEWELGTGDRLIIETLEGDMTCQAGDWVIKGVAGECYPCRADIFEATYEPVDFPEPGERRLNLLETDVR